MNNKIKKILEKSKVLAAPLCGYTDYPFRVVLSRFYPAIVFTEMLSVDGIIYNFDKTISLYKESNEGVALGIQLFGNKTENFAKACEKINKLNFDLIDINAGCSVRKVLKSGSGCALMKDPDKLNLIVKAVISNTDKPVTVKMRLGFDIKNYIECAQAVAEAGAAWITIHGRTKNQMFSGDIDYNAIGEIKKSISIPVIGNGEIWSPQDGEKMLSLTGCDAVMLARGLIGNPWLVKQCNDYFENGSYSLPGLKERKEIILFHLKLMVEDKGEIYGIREFRKHLVKYIKGIEGSKSFKEVALRIESQTDLANRIENLFSLNEVIV